MSRSSRPVQLTLALPPADYRAYVAAARILARIMGRKAPDALALIHHNLVKRDPTGVADDYLDSIGWPLAAGRAISVRRPARKPVRHSHGPLLLASPRVDEAKRMLVDGISCARRTGNTHAQSEMTAMLEELG